MTSFSDGRPLATDLTMNEVNHMKAKTFNQFTIVCGLKGYLELSNDALVVLYEECLTMCEFLEDETPLYNLCQVLGALHGVMGNHSKALKYVDKLLAISKARGDKEKVRFAYEILGEFYQFFPCYCLLDRFDKVIECYEYHLENAINLNDKMAMGVVYGKMGWASQLLYRYQESVEYFDKQASISAENGDKKQEANAHLNKGNAYHSLDEFNEAITSYDLALNIFIDINDKVGEEYAYLNLAQSCHSVANWEQALQFGKSALNIATEIDDKKSAGQANLQIGKAYSSLCQTNKAIEHLEIAREIGDRQCEASACVCIASFYSSQGQYEEAIQYGKTGLAIVLDIDDKKNEAATYMILGEAFDCLGKYRQAMIYYQKCLTIAKEIGSKRLEVQVYGDMVIGYRKLGKYDEGIRYSNRQLQIAKEIGLKWSEEIAYSNLGSNYYKLEKPKEAIEYHGKSLEIANELCDKQGQQSASLNLGLCYISLGEYNDAIKHLENAINIATEIGEKSGKGGACCNLGRVYMLLGNTNKAMELCEKSLDIAREINDRLLEAESLSFLGITYHLLSCTHKITDDLEKYQECIGKSRDYLEKSVKCCEWLFENLQEMDQFKISIVDTYIRIYQYLTKVMVEMQQTDKALVVSERGRARALGDLLALKYDMTNNDTSRVDPFKYTDVEKILSNHDFCIVVYEIHDDYAATWVLTHQNPCLYLETKIEMPIGQMVDTAYDTMMVRQAVDCEDRSLQVLEDGSHNDIDASLLKDKKSEIEEDIQSEVEKEAKSRCIWEEDLDDKGEALFQMYEVLIEPIYDKLVTKEIVVIPDGLLYQVPFAALTNPKTRLPISETKRIRIAPSLSLLKILEECSWDHHSSTGALIVGNPLVGEVTYRGETKTISCLPAAEKEAREIAKLLGVEPLIGAEATKEVIKKQLKEKVSLIHFAAHGSPEGVILLAPNRSKLAAGKLPEEEDYLLTMSEVQECGIQAQLVVLSCCHSGRGEIKSEGVIGMSRAFLAAGARAVVASLWAIIDDATMEFMLKFYSYLKEGKSAGTSLQQAMNEMRMKDKYSRPLFWAPFFLIGDDVTLTI